MNSYANEAEARAAVDITDKAFETVRARAALAGVALYVSSEAGRPVYLAVRWGWCKTLPDLAAVEAFLDRLGAPV